MEKIRLIGQLAAFLLFVDSSPIDQLIKLACVFSPYKTSYISLHEQ